MLPGTLSELDGYLADSEARWGDVRPGCEKTIIWGPQGQVRAPWAVVYLHGFTATRQELAPVPERVAQGLGGHVFYTRLSGHGRPAHAMERMTLRQWKDDVREALAIGRLLGERVLVMGTSTGATLAAWAALRAPEALSVAAWVMVSPNFRPKDPLAELFNWRLGRWLVEWVHGRHMGGPARSEARAKFWTTRHPTVALVPMMTLVAQLRTLRFEQVHTPLLMMYSRRDTVIHVPALLRAFARFGSVPKRLIDVDYSESPGQHVLAGDIDAPLATPRVVSEILAFARGLGA
ncbi:alpha/beta hydrolase [Roseateles koreensis]|uniref:Alpha/beta hydrolase n=1 Tax=Roseateles koreensis TaxID=2987526 RepID=A0ABT5KUJ6_9BURK|nr:alpha/beta hydrolase [Roseateles koreensis]